MQLQEESSGRREVPEETRTLTRGRSGMQTSSPMEVYDLATARRLAEQLLRCFQVGQLEENEARLREKIPPVPRIAVCC